MKDGKRTPRIKKRSMIVPPIGGYNTLEEYLIDNPEDAITGWDAVGDCELIANSKRSVSSIHRMAANDGYIANLYKRVRNQGLV